MKVFKFSNYGDSLGTRSLGARIRADLRPLLDSEEKLVLDFSGIDIVTNSFADECIAKLLLEMPLEELKSKTTFTLGTDRGSLHVTLGTDRGSGLPVKPAMTKKGPAKCRPFGLNVAGCLHREYANALLADSADVALLVTPGPGFNVTEVTAAAR